MSGIQSKKAFIHSCEIHCLLGGAPAAPAVVLLHGMKFQAATWHELGTLDILADGGFRPVAVDMPGFGLSPQCPADRDRVLEGLLHELETDRVILVGPSMGGRTALEFTISHPDMIKAQVLVGAVGIEENRTRLPSVTVPTLLVWGSEDRISPPANCDLLLAALPDAKKIIIEGAPHPCYLDNPDIWHKELLDFLNSVAG